MECMTLLGYGACAPDPNFRAKLPFPAFGSAGDSIPPMLRRRTSQATQMAFSAAATAFAKSGRSPANLPAIFASVAGEIQTTDQLCLELSKADGIVSPSAFHNSVQNTAAGYWSIAQHCTQPATALAAGLDTFAMGLLEAWCQLAYQGGELLLVCYDENWPAYLAPGLGWPAFASAFVLAAGRAENGLAYIGQPRFGSTDFSSNWVSMATIMPVLATLPLLEWLTTDRQSQILAISPASPGWEIRVEASTKQ
ncbi:beta-ketoacyl synthase chain length factor [Methylomonas sp. LL1]|uniref:beta-ketoacyl synthase chain length factor n=1 Tax=Methylomonas sp. LL1 TaxID=2785785 RepID=UPI0018C35247|nr:beta-ketoacyl synthase chain length factor [Methylomonas sp. LL1]QPK62923.1 beta-ketoacyl synthase chain length factor [Methylomonas sp. LL1]